MSYEQDLSNLNKAYKEWLFHKEELYRNFYHSECRFCEAYHKVFLKERKAIMEKYPEKVQELWLVYHDDDELDEYVP